MKKLFLAIFFLFSLGAFAQTEKAAMIHNLYGSVQTTYSGQDTVKLGLALSGGSARGYAHIGLLQALDDAGVQIDVISGTSMGAIIGVFYAAGFTPKQILNLVKKERMDNVKHIVRNNHKRDAGFADYRFLRRILYKYMPHNNFDSLAIRFYCCATDLNNSQPKIVGHGPMLAQFVTASASIPIVFTPVKIYGITYVDGFLTNNFPIEPLLEEKCNVTIGSYIKKDTVVTTFKKRNQIWGRIMSLSNMSNTYDRVPFFDYACAIDVHGLQAFDFDRVDDFFRYGYEAGVQLLKEYPEIKMHHKKIDENKRHRRPEE